MNMRQQRQQTGFTLVEMLLVMVIISMVIYGGLTYIQQQTLSARQEKASLQIQQILNAGLAYYIVNRNWPTSVTCLQGIGGGSCTQAYLPRNFTSPWGTAYSVASPSVGTNPPVLFYAYTSVTSAGGSSTGMASASANVIAGKLPMGYTTATNGSPPSQVGSGGTACGASTTTCYVVGSVNIPGQNLASAPAVNFAGLYHHGACVPVPLCPVDSNGNTMTPQIMVVPVSVSGVSDAPPSQNNVYPLSSFTAYARGPTAGTPPGCFVAVGAVSASACAPLTAGTTAPARYWRVCMQVVTVKGDVTSTRTSSADRWGNQVTMAAFTRCAIQNETSGSAFTVFTH